MEPIMCQIKCRNSYHPSRCTNIQTLNPNLSSDCKETKREAQIFRESYCLDSSTLMSLMEIIKT